ncbi:MAG: transketolase [Sedimentisphaerales bacterium]|nr:transketolase [Sedimentisphaerales bacterium]
MMSEGIDRLCIDTIRFLAADAVQKANSGHPGMPIGMAPTAYVLWTRILRHNPKDPRWPNRDRFVLSAGHGSMLLYALLHLTGYDMTLDDLKAFRQWGSKTPGHPEYEPGLGIEVTTGPLGQGLSNAVGMAIAQKYLAAYFNRENFRLFDFNIYVIAGDGCLQEGISSEACSLAGHLGLDNLVVIYDDNHITIDGPTDLSFTEDVVRRFKAYNWNVIEVPGDGTDIVAIEKAIRRARAYKGGPTLVKIRTHIAYGCPGKQDSHEAHGAPLGEEAIRQMKQAFGWDPDRQFYVPQEVYDHMRTCIDQGQKAQQAWRRLLDRYAKAYTDLAKQLQDGIEGRLPVDIDSLLPKFDPTKPIATRAASGKVLNALMPHLPLILGGSADLTPSNNTRFEGAKDFQKGQYDGRYIRFGVREHAMGAILNGISITKPLRAYGGTFLVFSDYMRPAVRVAAMAKYPSIFVWTHDSIGVGEDGPTHQPVEHAAALRAIPNLLVFRPADANETAQAWKYILQHADGPAALLLTRQALDVLDQTRYESASGVARGAYVLIRQDQPDCLLLATGSEVHIALAAAQKLDQEGIKAQVVSMPCWELFEAQPQSYKDQVLPPHCKARVAVEAQVGLGWHKWIGDHGIFVGMSTFGRSGPYKKCYEGFGITADAVAEAAKRSIASCRS